MLIFLDLETTGLDASDKICSIGIIGVSDDIGVENLYELINEGKKIPPKASSIHHITNEMIKDKTSFKESKSFEFLQKFNNEDTTIIAHNAMFDIEKLRTHGYLFRGKIVDTLRVSRHLIPECEEFSLQMLRYELKLYKDEKIQMQKCGIKDALVAHNAISDALIVKILFQYLSELCTLEEMYDLSFKNVLLSKFSFGKYSTRYIEDIAMSDRNYLLWMLNLEDLDEDLRYSIEYYLQG
jgi:DNA polymerase-3 subunit epsilon/exodeoxyribonuclease X